MSEQESKADLILLLHHQYVNERLNPPSFTREARLNRIVDGVFDESKQLAEGYKSLERQLAEAIAASERRLMLLDWALGWFKTGFVIDDEGPHPMWVDGAIKELDPTPQGAEREPGAPSAVGELYG